MASNYTEHLGLCQWEATDQVLRTEFNEDNAKIDAALSEIPNKGNCQIVYGTYKGTGFSGREYPTSLTFSGQPLIVLIGDYHTGGFLTLVQGCRYGTFCSVSMDGSGMVIINWETANAVSWYSDTSATAQANGSMHIYYYIALLAADSQ